MIQKWTHFEKKKKKKKKKKKILAHEDFVSGKTFVSFYNDFEQIE